MNKLLFDLQTHLAVTSQRTNTKRKERETSKSTKEDQKQQMKNNPPSCFELQRLPIHTFLWNNVSDETPFRPGSVFAQKLCHVEDDEHNSALDVFS